MKVFSSLILISVVVCLSVVGYELWRTLPGEVNVFDINIKTGNPEINISTPDTISQFYPNMRFNHNSISYSFSPSCNVEKIDGMKNAFSTLQEKTQILTFFEKTDNADIKIGCSEEELRHEKNILVAGEGGPSKFINSTIYPLILEGKIFLYKSTNCQGLTEMHELMHVFGFEHISNKNSLMYPYSDCSQTLDEAYISFLKQLYLIKPATELYFEKANISTAGAYLNFEVTIRNNGIMNANPVILEVYSDSEKVKEYDLKEIDAGEGKMFSVENMALPSRTKEITLNIKYSGEEFDRTNNKAIASAN